MCLLPRTIFAIFCSGHSLPTMANTEPFYVVHWASSSQFNCYGVLGVEKFSSKLEKKKIGGHKNGLVSHSDRQTERERERERGRVWVSEHRLRAFSKALHNAHSQHEMASLCDDFQWANFKIHPSFSFNPYALIVECCDRKDRNKQHKKVANESFAIYHRINWLQFNCITADGTIGETTIHRSIASKRERRKKKHTKEMKSNRRLA